MRKRIILAWLAAGAFGSVSAAWAQSEIGPGSGRWSAIESCMTQAQQQVPDQAAAKKREAVYRDCMKKRGQRP